MRGYLRYKCPTCGGLVKVPCKDVEADVLTAMRDTPELPHRCDELRIGITTLIGGTFSEEEPN